MLTVPRIFFALRFIFLLFRSIYSPLILSMFTQSASSENEKFGTAYFAWGCFWCMEWIFEAQSWVVDATVWYAWGTKEEATYERVSTWRTWHREWVAIVYDPSRISYEKLVDIFLTQIDPTQDDGQFADRWFQYTTAIYTKDKNENKIAEKKLLDLAQSWKFSAPIVVKVLPFTTFFPAESYHQNYYKTSSERYNRYKKWSGREEFIKKNWSHELETLTQDDVRKTLSPLAYHVTQECGTEPPFDNPYWNNHRKGIYVDIVDGTPLFSSLDKFDSGTGWPSFTRSIDPKNVSFREDTSLFSRRIEVRSKNADSHLGHVFDDGPKDLWWKRYCMNSAALRFIPYEALESEGYGVWKYLFESKDDA